MYYNAVHVPVPEFSIYNPRSLFRKSLSNNFDFLNNGPGVVYGKLWYCVVL